MKVRKVWAELLHVDGGTDIKTPDWANSRFAKICEAPKNDENTLTDFYLIREMKKSDQVHISRKNILYPS
jgi:hypothetical protein